MMKTRAARAGFFGLTMLLAACGGGREDLSGEDLAIEVGCLACHGEAGTDLAPSLVGLWGEEVLLEDGRTVVADEAYVRTSITDPGADIAAGYDGRMPRFALSDSEVDRLVGYVRSLG